MIYAMTCADDKYMPSAKFQLNTALKKGKVNKTLCYNLADMDKTFQNANKKIFELGKEKGAGFYLWKPYFVWKAISSIKSKDFLVYLDSAGFYYRSSIIPIVSYMQNYDIDMICSRRYRYLEKHWTKRDAFVYMGCDSPKYTEQVQAMSGFFVLRKTDKTIKLIQEWLMYAQDYRIITEVPNVSGLDNYIGFQQHRHDQSILSLLECKYDVKTIEASPIADFYVYHHTLETSVRAVKAELARKRRQQIKGCLRKKNLKGVYYIERERVKNVLWIQKILREKNYRNANNV